MRALAVPDSSTNGIEPWAGGTSVGMNSQFKAQDPVSARPSGYHKCNRRK